MSKVTPGPWIANKYTDICGHEVINVSQKDGAPYTPAYSDVCSTVSGEDLEIQIANANLIAAAPDLLESLEKMVAAYESLEGAQTAGGSWHSYALLAIAKAKGESDE